MNIHGYSQLTLLDYPGKVASTVFCGSCNFRCPFCHNASLVLDPASVPLISEDSIFEHLHKRSATLEGICITGGEPTLQNDLPEFLRRLRSETSLNIKLDTNGSRPEVISSLLSEGLVDHIAMDIKSSPEGYASAVGLSSFSMDEIFRSVDLIREKAPGYEFRTTVVEGIHSEADFQSIGKWLAGSKAYYLQSYKDSGELISPQGLTVVSRDMMFHYRDILTPYIPATQVRGID